MKYKKDGKEHIAVKTIKLTDGTVIGVFEGERGHNPDHDILIKYQEQGKRLRTPKHIHWVIDLLIKMEKNMPPEKPARVFKELMDALIQEKEIFVVVSKATQIGR